ncbi:MAG: hypothetical protein AABX30_02660 [Nanoarchaeota archaeon]
MVARTITPYEVREDLTDRLRDIQSRQDGAEYIQFCQENGFDLEDGYLADRGEIELLAERDLTTSEKIGRDLYECIELEGYSSFDYPDKIRTIFKENGIIKLPFMGRDTSIIAIGRYDLTKYAVSLMDNYKKLLRINPRVAFR